jgi:transposase
MAKATIEKFVPITREQATDIVFNNPSAAIDLLVKLSQAVCALQDRVEVLGAKLAMNSQNSSKPPSSDGLAKPAPKSLRTKSMRKSGGQPGHKGNTLIRVEKPDEVIKHNPEICPMCMEKCSGTPSLIASRQVFEMPIPKYIVEEHQIFAINCSCGHTVKGVFPSHVTAPVQYGPRFKAFVTLLVSEQTLPMKRSTELVEVQTGLRISEGTINNFLSQVHQSEVLKAELATIATAITSSPIAHFDETGLRTTGKLHWVHSSSTATNTLLHVHERRGFKGAKAGGIVENFDGIAVHDAWSAYWHMQVEHALCNAHILRELKWAEECAGYKWPRRMTTIITGAKFAADKARAESYPEVNEDERQAFLGLYRSTLESGFQELAKKVGNKKISSTNRKVKNLLNRLESREKEVLRFLNNLIVPFDNNQAERDIRMVKVKQKVAGSFRTVTGAETFKRVYTTLCKVKKHKGEKRWFLQLCLTS